MTQCRPLLLTARAAALFASPLSARRSYHPCEIELAVKESLRVHGGTRNCAGEVAAAYGDHPELAIPRMRWALSVVQQLYERPDHVQRRATGLARASGPGQRGRVCPRERHWSVADARADCYPCSAKACAPYCGWHDGRMSPAAAAPIRMTRVTKQRRRLPSVPGSEYLRWRRYTIRCP